MTQAELSYVCDYLHKFNGDAQDQTSAFKMNLEKYIKWLTTSFENGRMVLEGPQTEQAIEEMRQAVDAVRFWTEILTAKVQKTIDHNARTLMWLYVPVDVSELEMFT